MNGTIPMPLLGFGTYGRRGPEGVQAIELALATGYRHLDTAQDYNTEAEVGQALRQSGLARDSVSKVVRTEILGPVSMTRWQQDRADGTGT